MADINEKILEHLFALSRIKPEQNKHKREKLLADIRNILDYFKELQEVDTSHTEPLAGGSFLSGVARKDEAAGKSSEKQNDLLGGQFSEHENGYLKTPPVFE